MRIKRLNLPTYVTDQLTVSKISVLFPNFTNKEWFLKTFPEMSPIIGKDGWYKQGKDSWFEFAGKAYSSAKAIDFDFALSLLNAAQLTKEELDNGWKIIRGFEAEKVPIGRFTESLRWSQCVYDDKQTKLKSRREIQRFLHELRLKGILIRKPQKQPSIL